MKYLLFLVFFSSCVHKVKQEYPRVVHNKCKNTWAVQTSKNLYLSDHIQLGSINSSNYIIIPFINENGLGYEANFSTKDSAENFCKKWIRDNYTKDSTEKRNQFIDDSIFKCQHSYE